MKVIVPSDCLACLRLRLGDAGQFSCAAFPRGIPSDLFEGRANHRVPYPGDGGLRFTPDRDIPEEALRELAAFA
jgi:hypothetical protein